MGKKIDQKQEELKKQITILENNWKRALADYQNLQKRTEAEKEELYKFVSKSIIKKLLPLLDTLEKAAEVTKEDGLNLAVKQFRSLLESEGVTEVEALEKPFDPRFHECIDTEEGEEENKIVKVYTKGYKIDGEVIRPARVRVIKKKIDKKAEELAKKAKETGDYM